MKKLWFGMLLVLVSTGLAAKGTQEKDFQEAQGKDNFSQSVDLTQLKPGQYNILVRTKDAAGNISYAGPYNFYYDPSSDNPLITVANPSPGQRLGASLNVVGVASAPKGVASVEAQVDGGPWTAAKGKAFWSYFLNAGGLPDGPHKIAVRGTDVNGVVGPITTVAFHLDQSLPVFSLASVKSGDRVNGVVTLDGTLADGNGLKLLELSTDGQKTSQRIDLQGDANATSRTFRTQVDTKRFPDGPLVLWFHGVDGQGSEIRRAVLLFVDNTVPVITVLSPAADAGLHGKTRFAVQVEKPLGIRTLTGRVGDKGEPVEAKVVPGNPFYVLDLDLPARGVGTVPVIFESIDTAGKLGRTVYTAHLNGDTDVATFALAAELDKAVVKAPFHLRGTVRATDGPAGLAYALNGAPEVVQPVGAAFDFVLPGLVSGANKLVLTPVDTTGKRGKPVTYAFSATLEAPVVTLEALVSPTGEVPFRPGLNVAPDQKNRLKGSVRWPNPPKSLSWTLGDKTYPVPTTGLVAGVLPLALALPDDPPFGVAPVTITATDAYDQVTTLRTFVDVANLARPQGADGMAFADARLGTNPLVITPETPLRGWFANGKIRSADLLTEKGTVPTAVLQATNDGAFVTIKALKDGQFDGVRLKVVNDKGRVYETPLGTVISDLAPPTIALASPLVGSWAKEQLTIEGTVSDTSGVTRLEWSIDNGKTWQPLDPPNGQGGAFKRTLNLPGPDNMVNLLVRAGDNAGRTGTVLTVVRRDTTAPTVDVVVPSVAPGTTGAVVLVGRFKDEGALQKAEAVIDRKTYPLPIDKPFTLNVDAGLATPILFRVSDWAGNVTEQNVSLAAAEAPAPTAANAAPKPSVEILFPKADTKGLNGTIPIVGRVVNFSSPPAVSVKGENGVVNAELTEAGYFSLEANVSTLKNRSLAFTATGAGKEAAALTLTLPFDAASELPTARFLPQTEKPVITGNVAVSGWIGDSRGVVSWVSQLDAGEKKPGAPDPAKPPVGSFLVDLGVPAFGPHKLTVWPVNAAGQQGPPAVTEFVSTAPAGPVEFTNLDLAASVNVGKDSRIQGKLSSPNAWKTVEIRFADLAQPDAWNGAFMPLAVKKDPSGAWTFDVPVPATLPYGRVGVIVRGEDALGQKVEGRTLFHRVWAKDPAAIRDDEGLVFLDTRLQENGRADIVPGQPLQGVFRGRPIKTISLTPAQAALTVTNDNGKLGIDTTVEGLYGPFTLSVTTVDGEVFSSSPLTLFADAGGPLLEWETPVNADWIRDSVALKGKVNDPSTVTTLEASVDGGASWQVVPVKAGVFDTKLPVTVDDGLVSVALKATDKGGHTTVESRAITKDASAPAWTLVAPPQERKVNGLTTLIGTATDLNPIVGIEYSDDGKVFKAANGLGTFAFDLDFASYAKLPEQFFIRTTDSAGNQAVTPLVVPLDQAADKPVVQIQTPADGDVVRSDFALSGMAFDDDAIKTLSWRIDGGTWLKLEGVSSFQIPIALASLTDNEHTIEVQAEDLYGTKGDVFKSVFKVSLEAPSAVLFTPEIDKTVLGVVGLVGGSFDRNGVEGVQISLDNGLTWNRAELRNTEAVLAASGADQVKAFLPTQRKEWEWRFDSRTLKDGTYLVMIKSTDSYGTEGLSTTLVNIDNTAPSLTLTSPEDGHGVLDSIDLQGRGGDNIGLLSLKAELRPIEGPAPVSVPTGRGIPVPAPATAAILSTDLPVTPTFNKPWSIGSLTPGWYNLRLEAKDAAGNSTYVARNIRVEGASADKVELLYPQVGETLSGSFVLEGKVTSRNPIDTVVITIDGKAKVTGTVDSHGYFTVPFDGTQLEEGDHTVLAQVQPSATVTLSSEPRKMQFTALGPWISVGSHKSGAFVTQRPFLSGTAGWNADPLPSGATPQETDAYRKLQESHKVEIVEVSLDNGKTWTPAQGQETWKYRLESLALPDGPQPLVFRAKYRDGTTRFQRLLVTVAQTPPTVKLLTPIENGRFNGSLSLAGFTEGDGEVQSVEVAVRQGDKAGYEVPQFIQGAYLDAHFLGATTWEAGLGLTFFQEAVKLQAQIGQTPQLLPNGQTNRFFGTIAGAKLIASILQLPAGYYFGPDWAWLSSSFGVGATFNEFSMRPNFLDFTSEQIDASSGNPVDPVMLGGVILQWEIARFLARDWTFFKSASFYSEATVYFISSDVDATAQWVFSGGVRVGLF